MQTWFTARMNNHTIALATWACFALGVPAATGSDRDAVKAIGRTMPAVLSITTYSGARGEVGTLREVDIENVASGFFIDRQGHLITNAHVLEAGKRVRVIVTTQEGHEYEAHPIAVDTQADLALLKVNATEDTRFKYLNLKRLSENQLGQTVIALGNPVGYGNSISRGVLSANNRSVSLDGMVYEGLLQTDAAINPGSSGGPIVDLSGRLVGVSSVKLAFDEAGMPLQGIGFAIPAAQVVSVLKQMEADDGRQAAAPTRVRSERGFLTSWLPRFGGAEGSGQSVPVALALDRLGVEIALPGGRGKRSANEPPVIADVYLDSPAEHAGLRPGEYIFRVNRLKLDVGNDFTQASLPNPGNAQVELEVGAIVRQDGRDWKQVRVVHLQPEPQ